tara:strand:- start:210 stop:578 length:369 start_codon:yes stop_codon:yes gene_type:complete
MKKFIFIFILVSSFILSQTETHTINGTHTLTQQNNMGITEAIDIALREALVDGLYDHLSTCDDYENFTDEEIAGFMVILSGAVEMCAMEPHIVSQTIINNTITIKASAQVNSFIINQFLGIE